MTTRKIAILTAHKAYGKSDITKKILKSCSVSLLAQDCEIRDKMFDEFGECGNMDETLQMWGETHDRKKIHERMVELYTKALTQKKKPAILTEGYTFYLRDHRRALYDAIDRLSWNSVEICLVEFRLLLTDEIIHRKIRADEERSGSEKLAKLSLHQQTKWANKRINEWGKKFELPDAQELRILSDFQQFTSSDKAADFLMGWLHATCVTTNSL